jgi:L-sorbose 1-phosphate reductase
LKPDGTLWVIGAGGNKKYTISKGFDKQSHPAKLLLTNVPVEFEKTLRQWSKQLGVEVIDVPDITNVPVEWVDDIVLLGADPDIVEKVSPKLDRFGILALIADEPMTRKVSTDVGRIHYQRWLYVGGTDPDVALAYSKTPLRSALKKGGKTLYVGSGGPIGRMHVQRAIQFPDPPAVIVCTDVSDLRLNDLYISFKDEAKKKGIDFICLNPTNKDAYAAGMAPFMQDKFDDVIVLAPVAPVIADSATYLAKAGVMNVFAGVGRGTMVNLDLSEVYLKNIRVIGHSGSELEDMQLTLEKVLSGELETNRAIAAIGSLSAGKDGLQAVKDTTYPGKIVLYNHIKEMPLTSLPEFKEKFPTVYAKFRNGREWTNEAEIEFLQIMLP